MIVNLGAGVEHIVLQAGHSVMVSKPRARQSSTMP
jgi:hypothetical protein